ncbi:MAG: hypothetical protein ABIF71_12750 [Planctomycetota bacterium]
MTFVEAVGRDRRLVPAAVLASSGPVEHPAALLRDDSAHALLGRPNYGAAMLDPALAEERGMITVSLQAAP